MELAFRGGFSGRVSLLFSAEDSNTLASLMAQGDWIAPEELHEFKMEALDEVGNILANALIGSISTLLGETVTYMPPQSSDVRGRDTQTATAEGTGCFRFRTAFSGEVPGTQGCFVVSVDVEDLSRFLERLSA